MLIRSATPEDAAEVSAVIRDAYAQLESAYPADFPRYIDMVAKVDTHFAAADVIVAEEGGRLTGCVFLYPDAAVSGQGTWPAGAASMLRLAVRPEAQGQGLGRRLTEACIDRCREAGITTLALHTTDWMAVAKAMYERMGFVRDAEHDFVPRSGVYAYCYRLDVG